MLLTNTLLRYGSMLVSFNGLYKSVFIHTQMVILTIVNTATFAFEKLKNNCSIRYYKVKVTLTIVVKCNYSHHLEKSIFFNVKKYSISTRF